VTTYCRNNTDYAGTGALADLRMFGGYSILVDRTASGGAVFPELKSTIMLVDCLGTERRDCQIGDVTFRGASAPGSFCLMPAGQAVSFKWDSDKPASNCIAIEADFATFERVVPELAAERLQTGAFAPTAFAPAQRLVPLARLLQMERPDDPASSPAWVEDVLRLFLTEALRIGGADAALVRGDRFRMDKRLRLAVDYIEAHLGERVGLLDVSLVAGLSPTHLSTLFRTELGVSPHSYIIERRLARARQRLARSDDPIALVALECGFSDQAHMTRVFRQRLGQTPAAFRRGREPA
jgi:AraC-like DNA-binding protein